MPGGGPGAGGDRLGAGQQDCRELACLILNGRDAGGHEAGGVAAGQREAERGPAGRLRALGHYLVAAGAALPGPPRAYRQRHPGTLVARRQRSLQLGDLPPAALTGGTERVTVGGDDPARVAMPDRQVAVGVSVG